MHADENIAPCVGEAHGRRRGVSSWYGQSGSLCIVALFNGSGALSSEYVSQTLHLDEEICISLLEWLRCQPLMRRLVLMGDRARIKVRLTVFSIT